MRDGNRAAFSAAMLAGFWLIAWLQVAVVLVVVLVVLSLLPGGLALRAAAPLCIATAGLLGYATVRALRLRHASPAGVPVTRADAPALWSMIDSAAAAAGVAAPDGVTVIAEATASLTERTRLAGLLGGRRELYLGLPLLQAWDAARLRAAVAHELAHGSARLGRLAPLAHRGRVAVGRLVPRIPARNPAGPLLRAYAGWYRERDAPFSRAQELAADQVAASFAGPRAAAAMLRDGPALDGLQRLFHAEYLSPGWQAGYVPDDVFGGFLRVLAARADEVALLRAQHPEPPPAWDTHPPVTERLAALTALLAPTPTSPGVPGAEVTEPGANALRVADPGEPAPRPAEPGVAGGADGGVLVMRAAGAGGGADEIADSAAVAAEPSGAGPASAGRAADLGDADARVAERTAAAAGPGAASLGDAESGGGAVSEVRPAGTHSAGAAGVGPGIPDEGGESPAAGDMVPDLPGLGRALQAVAYPVAGRTVAGWDEFFGVARKAEMEREADAALRAVSRAAGTPVAGAAAVFDLVADGRLREVAKTVFGDLPPEETSEHITGLITLLLALAALNSGVARWRHSWTGTAELVALDGSHLDLGGPAALAGDPATVGVARERLAALGIDPAATAGGPHPAARVPVLGGVVNVLVDGARTDLLVVETGLLLVPGLPRSRAGEAKRRLARLAAGGVRVDGSAVGPPVPGTGGPPAGRPGFAADGSAAGSPGFAADGSAAGSPGFAADGSATGSRGSGADGSAVRSPGFAADGSAAGSPGSAADGSVARSPGSAAVGSVARAAGSAAGGSAIGSPGSAVGGSAVGSSGSAAGGGGADSSVGVVGSRFVPFADVAAAVAVPSRRRNWEVSLQDGGTLTIRTALDSDELPGGWTALDDAVAFLSRTR